MEKNPAWKKMWTRDEHPRSFVRELRNSFRVKNTKMLLNGSGIRNLFDPGSGMEIFGSGINIPDPQH
jgi:hypothetical protein